MADQMRATKLWLQRQFKTAGIQLDPAALDELVRVVQDVPDPQTFVDSLIDEIETGKRGGATAAAATGPANRRRQAAAACAGLALPAEPRSTLPMRAVSDERRVTRALLDSTLATLEGRSAPQDPVQARTMAAACLPSASRQPAP